MSYFCLYNFISALFIDRTVLSLTYHLGKHWSLKDELFSACIILRVVVLPRTGTQNLCWHQIHTKHSSTSSMVLNTYSETIQLWGGCWESASGFCLGSQIKKKFIRNEHKAVVLHAENSSLSRPWNLIGRAQEGTLPCFMCECTALVSSCRLLSLSSPGNASALAVVLQVQLAGKSQQP